MLQRQVVPHDEVAYFPVMLIAHRVIVEVGPQLVEEIFTLLLPELDDAIGHQFVDEQEWPIGQGMCEHDRMRRCRRLRCGRDAKPLRAVIVSVVIDMPCVELCDA